MIGFRILPRRRKVDAALVAQFRGLPVAVQLPVVGS